MLLYGSVSQGQGATKFMNLIGWNRCWKWSRFAHLDLSRLDSSPVLFCSEKVAKCKIIDYFHLTILIYRSAKKAAEKINGTQCMQKWWHLTAISKILSRKLENKQANGCLNHPRTQCLCSLWPACFVKPGWTARNEDSRYETDT